MPETTQVLVAADRSLARRMARGDDQALQELYRRHGHTVYALAYGLLTDAPGAEEVVAETFEHARHAAPQLAGSDASILSWLTATARNRACGVLLARSSPQRQSRSPWEETS